MRHYWGDLPHPKRLDGVFFFLCIFSRVLSASVVCFGVLCCCCCLLSNHFNYSLIDSAALFPSDVHFALVKSGGFVCFSFSTFEKITVSHVDQMNRVINQTCWNCLRMKDKSFGRLFHFEANQIRLLGRVERNGKQTTRPMSLSTCSHKYTWARAWFPFRMFEKFR